MEQIIRKFYTEVFKIKNPETLEYLVSNSTLKHVKKNTVVLKQGDIIDKIWFIYTGFLIGYVYKSPRRKDINSFNWEPGVPLIHDVNFEKEVAHNNIMSIVDSTYIITEFDVIKKAIAMDEDAKNVLIHLLETAFQFQRKVKTMRTLPAKERVQFFFEEFGQFASYLTNTHIAAFLDMSRGEYVKTLKLLRE